MDNRSKYRRGEIINDKFLIHDVKMGGMGEVYLCLDIEQNFPCALKTFQQRFVTNTRLRAAFEREVMTWISLDAHPNIVTCYWMQVINGQPFMCLDWVPGAEGIGTDLRCWLKWGHLDTRTSIEYTADICRGLVYAQQKSPGIVHCDLKPENILIMNGRLAQITDFGLAQLAKEAELKLSLRNDWQNSAIRNPTLSTERGIVGTPLYMSPEQWLGEELDPRSDIYAIGCILYEQLTGTPPFVAGSIEEIRKMHLEAVAPQISANQPFITQLNEIILCCLEKDRGNRFFSHNELLSELIDLYKKIFDTALEKEYPQTEELPASYYASRGNTYGELELFEESIECYEKAMQIDPVNVNILSNRALTFMRMRDYQQALADVNKALEIDPEYLLARYNKAMILGHKGDLQGALIEQSQFIKIRPDDPSGFINRGVTYNLLGLYHEAISDFEKAIQLNSENATCYINRARSYAQLGQFESAFEDLDRAIAIDPASSQAYSIRGDILFDLAKYDPAIKEFEIAINFDPNQEALYVGRGLCYHELKNFHAAFEDFSTAIKINPKCVEAYNNRGITNKDLGKWEEAFSDYAQALNISPNNSPTYISRSQLYLSLKLFDKAIDDCTRAIELSPGKATAYSTRGHIYFLMNNIDMALKDCNQAIQIDPNCAEAYFNLGIIFDNIDDLNKSLASYCKAISLKPNFANAYLNRGTIYGSLDKANLALDDLNTAIKLDPELQHAYLNRGTLYSKLKKYELALDDFNQAIRLDSNDYLTYINRGNTYTIQKRYSEALFDLDKAISIEPDNYMGYLERGKVYQICGQYNEALRDFNRAIELDKKRAEPYFITALLLIGLGHAGQSISYLEQAASLGFPSASLLLHQGKLSILIYLLQKSNSSSNYIERVRKLSFHLDNSLIADFRSTIQEYGASVSLKEHLNALSELNKEQELCPNFIDPIFQPVTCLEDEEFIMNVPTDFFSLNDDSVDSGSDEIEANLDYWMALAFSCIDQKEFRRAIDSFSSALLFQPNNHKIFGGRAYAYLAIEEYDLAMKDINRALLLEPNEAHYLYFRGSLNLKMGQRTASLEDFKQAKGKERKDDSIFMSIGNELMKNEMKEEAIEFYEKAAILGNIDAYDYVHEFLHECAIESWMSAKTVEEMEIVLKKYPHVASPVYVQSQYQRFVIDRPSVEKVFFAPQLELLSRVVKEEGNEFFLEAIEITQEFAEADSKESLRRLLKKHSLLRRPGYIVFVLQIIIREFATDKDLKHVLQERMVQLYDLLNY